MSFLYWLALIIGGGLFLLSLAGDVLGLDAHSGDALHGSIDVHGDHEWGRVFSLRNLTYFLFAFGAVGVLLGYAWHGEHALLELILASLMGLGAGMLSFQMFKYLRRTESGAMHGDQLLIGRVGAVTLPLNKDGTGKISVPRAGGTQELLAKPLDANEPDPESWSSVVVVDVQDGVALVAPYTEPEQS